MTVYEAELAVIEALRELRALPMWFIGPRTVLNPIWRHQLEAAFAALDALEVVVKEEAP